MRRLLDRVRAALAEADLWGRLQTDWAVLDCELMPWSAKAQELLRTQYAAVGAAGSASLPRAVSALEQAAGRLTGPEKDGLVALLKRLKGHGLTIFIIDHDMAMVEQVADHITVLNFGKRIADGAPADVLRHPDVVAAYLGEELPARSHGAS